MDRATMTVEEAARVLGIARNTAYQAARTGDIPAVRIGRRVIVPRAALETMLGLRCGNERDGESDHAQT